MCARDRWRYCIQAACFNFQFSIPFFLPFAFCPLLFALSTPASAQVIADKNVASVTNGSGTVATGKEKQTAKRIAQSYAGNRKVKDHLTVSGQGSSDNKNPDSSTSTPPSSNSPTTPDPNRPAYPPASSRPPKN